MPYPSKNTNGYSSTSKNSSAFTMPEQSGQNYLLIESPYVLLIDSDNKLLLEPVSTDWSYSAKN